MPIGEVERTETRTHLNRSFLFCVLSDGGAQTDSFLGTHVLHHSRNALRFLRRDYSRRRQRIEMRYHYRLLMALIAASRGVDAPRYWNDKKKICGKITAFDLSGV